jgi:GNAT superfamily N-acetyltransferase
MTEQIVQEQEGDERVFKLFVDGKTVCSARTLPYSLLLNITTTKGEEGKGYGKKLLSHIEKVAKEHNVTVMKTDDIDPCNYKAVCLFKSMGYRFEQIEGDKRNFIEATKDLWRNEVLRLAQLVDKKFKKFSLDMLLYSPYFSMFLALFLMLVLVESYLFSINDVGKQLSVAIPFSAFILAFSVPFYHSIPETCAERNYVRISKTEEENDKPLLRALIKMKTQNINFKLERIYNMNPSMFTKEKLLEILYEQNL